MEIRAFLPVSWYEDYGHFYPCPQPQPLAPAHVLGQNFDPFAFQKLRLGHI
jgi:hypothetical protein